MLYPHTAPAHDPIREIEEALVAARRRIAKMREGNFVTVLAAHDAIVNVADKMVAAFRQIEGHRLRADP